MVMVLSSRILADTVRGEITGSRETMMRGYCYLAVHRLGRIARAVSCGVGEIAGDGCSILRDRYP